MSWKKVGGYHQTKNNYIVRTPESTVGREQITNYLGRSRTSQNSFSALNVNDALTIIKNDNQYNPNLKYQEDVFSIWNGSTNSDSIHNSLIIYHANREDVELKKVKEAERFKESRKGFNERANKRKEERIQKRNEMLKKKGKLTRRVKHTVDT